MNKENTFRALADQPLVVERWQCRVKWHRWGQWTNIERSPGYSDKYETWRRCVSCNWAQKNTRTMR